MGIKQTKGGQIFVFLGVTICLRLAGFKIAYAKYRKTDPRSVGWIFSRGREVGLEELTRLLLLLWAARTAGTYIRNKSICAF